MQASRLLTNPNILTKIRAKQNAILSRMEISVERVLREAACVAFLNPATLFDAEGNRGRGAEACSLGGPYPLNAIL